MIRKNAEVFATAAASVLGSQRNGDQLGPMLAGAWSLVDDTVINYDQAREFIEEQRSQFGAYLPGESQRDEIALLDYLLAVQLRVETSNSGSKTLSVAELISAASGVSDIVLEGDAQSLLKRNGIKVDISKDCFFISNTHPNLKKILSDTDWMSKWNILLSRIDGAEAGGTQHFGPGSKSRAVKLPLHLVIDTSENQNFY